MDTSTSIDTAFSLFSLDGAYSALAIVVVLGGLIFFHELGHFLAAKSFRVGVKTFSLGFGPRLLGFRRGQTDYQVAILPLGGYVSMVGESDPADIPAPFTEKDSFALRPSWQRLIIIAAGPLFNILLAWMIYWGIFYINGEDYLLPQIGIVAENSAARDAGLLPMDRLTAINGSPTEQWDDLLKSVMASKGAAMELSVTRGEEQLSFTVTPRPFERKTLFGEINTSWAIGVSPSGAFATREFNFFGAASRGANHTILVTKLIGESIVKLVERVIPMESMGGPIRIAKEIHTQAHSGGAKALLMLAAFISLNLGLLNLLPIPVLDGGHIFFLVIEIIRRKPASERLQEISIKMGLALLLGMLIFVTYNDIAQWIQGKL